MTVNLEAVKAALKDMTPGPWVNATVHGQCHKSHGPDEDGPGHGAGFCVYDQELHHHNECLSSEATMRELVGWGECGTILASGDAIGHQSFFGI